MADGFFAPSRGNSLMPRRPRRKLTPDFEFEQAQPRGPLADSGFYQDFSIPGGEDAGDTVARISSVPQQAVPGPEALALQAQAAQNTGQQQPFSLSGPTAAGGAAFGSTDRDGGGGFSLDDGYDPLSDPAYLAEAQAVADARSGAAASLFPWNPARGFEGLDARVARRQFELGNAARDPAFLRRWLARRAVQQQPFRDPVTGLLRPGFQPPFVPGLQDPTPPRR